MKNEEWMHASEEMSLNLVSFEGCFEVEVEGFFGSWKWNRGPFALSFAAWVEARGIIFCSGVACGLACVKIAGMNALLTEALGSDPLFKYNLQQG